MKSRKKHLALAAAIFCSSALLAVLTHTPAVHGEQSATSEISRRDAVPAEFRGCESARTCRFHIEASTPLAESLLVVRPNGVLAGDAHATAVRNRLNVLMSSMIHQHKRIELQDLRKLDDGAYAASIEVNGMDLREDPILVNLTKASKTRSCHFELPVSAAPILPTNHQPRSRCGSSPAGTDPPSMK